MGLNLSVCLHGGRHKRSAQFQSNISVLEPPDWTDDERSGSFARQFVQRMSEFVTPTTVDRAGMHSININSENRLTKQASLSRRMSSLTPPIQGTATSMNEIWTDYRKELEFTIHKEKTKDHEVAAPDLLSQEARLRKRLGKLNMDMNACQGDGNCLFRAISMELWKSEDYHKAVRRKAVRYMRENKEDFEGFLGEEFDEYMSKMNQVGTWGDELTLRAACDAYGIIVNVLTSDQHNWFMRYLPKMVKHAKEVFLTYIAPVHYNTIKRKGALQILRHSGSLTRKSIIETALDKADEAQKEMESIPEAPSLQDERISTESREGQPGQTSVEIAKALGHPPAAGAYLSSLAEHPSPVSNPSNPVAPSSSQGAIAGSTLAQAGLPELQSTSVSKDGSQHSGSNLSQSSRPGLSRLSQVSPFSAPEVQFEPRKSLDSMQPAVITPEAYTNIVLEHRSPQKDQPLSSRPKNAQDHLSAGGMSGTQAAQHTPVSSTAVPADNSDQSRHALQDCPQTGGNPFAESNGTGAHAAGTTVASVRDTEHQDEFSQPSQNLHSSPRPSYQARVAYSSQEGDNSSSATIPDEAHSKRVRQNEILGTPTVDDVLSGRSAVTDRAALQELMDIKAPVSVSESTPRALACHL